MYRHFIGSLWNLADAMGYASTGSGGTRLPDSSSTYRLRGMKASGFIPFEERNCA